MKLIRITAHQDNIELAATRGLMLQAYTEYARQVLDKADSEFNSAVSRWSTKYQQVHHRLYFVSVRKDRTRKGNMRTTLCIIKHS